MLRRIRDVCHIMLEYRNGVLSAVEHTIPESFIRNHI